MKRFQCISDCSICCEQAGWVNVSLADLGRMSKALQQPKHEIFRNHLSVKPWVTNGVMMSYGIKLLQPCHFLKDGKCSIYEARPDACKIFPYNLIIYQVDIEAWLCIKGVKITGFEKEKYTELMRKSWQLRGETESALPSLRNIQPYLKRMNEIQGEAIMSKTPLQLALYLGLKGVMEDVFKDVCRELEMMEESK